MNRQEQKQGFTHEEDFRGDASEMKDSPFLASEDILALNVPGQEPGTVITEILNVTVAKNVTFEKGLKKDKVFLLHVKNRANKKLVINATNRKIMVNAWGSKAGNWIGKKVKLYVDPNVKFQGKKVKGIRLQPMDSPDPDPVADEPAGEDPLNDESFIPEQE